MAKQVFPQGHNAINFLLLLAIADDAIGLVIIAVAFADNIYPVWLLLVAAAVCLAAVMRYPFSPSLSLSPSPSLSSSSSSVCPQLTSRGHT